MLKNKTKILTIFLVIILLFSTFVLADNETNENEIMPISEQVNETINSSEDNNTVTSETSNNSYKKNDVYLLEDNVIVDYTIDGNLFVCANTVTLNSKIGGDVFVIAKTLIVDEQAYIFSNLFATADSIEVKGTIYDVYALAKTMTISNGKIYRDIKLTAQTFNINGVISRNAFIIAPNINFNTDNNSNGCIYGNLNYYSDSKLDFPENVVNGNINYNSIKNTKSVADYILNLGRFIAFILIIWLICLWLTPEFLENTNNYIGKRTLNILGFGLLALILIPIICLILLLLRLTAGISLLLLALYFLTIEISKALFTIIINNFICTKLNIDKDTIKFGILILTSIVVWALTKIPYINIAMFILISISGLGILVSAIISKSKNKISEE